MKLTLLQETTSDWTCPVSNNVYIFSDSSWRIVGYIKKGETVAIRFDKPLLFDKKRRTFEKLTAKQIKQFDLSALT